MKKNKLISLCTLAGGAIVSASILSVTLSSCGQTKSTTDQYDATLNSQLSIIPGLSTDVFTANIENDSMSNVNWYTTTEININNFQNKLISGLSFINNSQHILSGNELNIQSENVKNSEDDYLFYVVDRALEDGRTFIEISSPVEINTLVGSSNDQPSTTTKPGSTNTTKPGSTSTTIKPVTKVETTATITTKLSNFDLSIHGKQTVAISAKSNDGSALQYKWYVKKSNGTFENVQTGNSPKYTLDGTNVQDPGTIWEIKVDVFKSGNLSKILATSQCKVRFVKAENPFNIQLKQPNFIGENITNVDTSSLTGKTYEFPNKQQTSQISTFDSIILANNTNVKIDVSANTITNKKTGAPYSKGMEYQWFYRESIGNETPTYINNGAWTCDSTLDLSKLNLDSNKMYIFGYFARPVTENTTYYDCVQSNNIYVYFSNNSENNGDGTIEVVPPTQNPDLGYNKSETIIYSDNIVVEQGLEETTIAKNFNKKFNVVAKSTNNARLKYYWYVDRGNGYVLENTNGSEFTLERSNIANIGDTWKIKVEIYDATNMKQVLAMSQCLATIVNFESNYEITLGSTKFVGSDVTEEKVITIKENDQYFGKRYKFPNKEQTQLLASGDTILNGDSKNVKIDASNTTIIDKKTGLPFANGAEFRWTYWDSLDQLQPYYVNNGEWTSNSELDLSTLNLDSNKMYIFNYSVRPATDTDYNYEIVQSNNIYVYFSDTSIIIDRLQIEGNDLSNVKNIENKNSQYFGKEYTFWNGQKTNYKLSTGCSVIDGASVNDNFKITSDYRLFNKDTGTTIPVGDGKIEFFWYLNDQLLDIKTKSINLSDLHLEANKIYTLKSCVKYTYPNSQSGIGFESGNIAICLK
ncbi:MAG: hypothetical protein K2I36_02515 [Ureaplasma sp.]|nr:hypothetical protein [Ureaplasma sp.]MDE7221967.1 hypothetical protein [Ureaplasma sp.]